MHARQLRHLAGAEDQDVQPRQLAEDLLGELDRGVAHRDRPFAEPGLRAHAFADGERGVKQPVRHRAGALHVARGRVRGLDLAEDLRLADDERVEAGGDAEQMARRIGAAMAVEVVGERGRVDAVVVAEEAIDGVDRRLRIADGVDLGAVARRQHDRFVADAARGERVSAASIPSRAKSTASRSSTGAVR